MKKIFSILFCFVTLNACAQSRIPLNADSIVVKGEFVLNSKTKDTIGFLLNMGGGVTEFRRIRKLNDSAFIAGKDTIVIRGTGAGSVETATNVGGGAGIYKTKSGTQFQFKTLTSDTSLVFIPGTDTLQIVVDPGKFASVQRLKDTAAALRVAIGSGPGGTDISIVRTVVADSNIIIRQEIADAVANVFIDFDPVFIKTGNHVSLDTTDKIGTIHNEAVLQALIDAANTRITDTAAALRAAIGSGGGGPGGGKTQIISNSSVGDSSIRKINDSLYVQKKWISGANTHYGSTDSTQYINADSVGSTEVNAQSFTLVASGNRTVTANKMLTIIMVKPTSDLAAFKAGYLADAEAIVHSSVCVGGKWTEFIVNEYIENTSAVYFAGITASTAIIILTPPIHP